VSGRAGVQLGSLVFSLAVIAILLKAQPRPAPHDPQPPDATADPVTLAASILFHAGQLSSATAGYSGITPPEVLAWRVIVFSPGADSVFNSLANQASVAGRLYALAGVKVTDPVAFAKLALALQRRGGVVSTMDGCAMTTERVKDAVAQIDRGDWIRSFLSDSFHLSLE